MAYCAVFGCENNQKKTKNINFYRFPKDPRICEEWVQFCERKNKINIGNGKQITFTASKQAFSITARVCSIHFEEKYLHKSTQHNLLNYSPKNRRKIMLTAIPTIHGPSTFLLNKRCTADVSNSGFIEYRQHDVTPTKKGSTKKTNVSECRKELFKVKPANSQESLNVHDNESCPWKLKYETLQEEYTRIVSEKSQIEKENKILKKKNIGRKRR